MLREARYGFPMSGPGETAVELAELFAAPLAGHQICADRASLVVVEWRDPGGGGDPPMYIAPLHIHRDDDEAWYVVEGSLMVRLGQHDVEVPAGGAVLVPRGTPHTYWNPTPTPTRYVLVMTPRIKGLIDAIHGLTERSQDTLETTFREHSSEYLGWP
jgi:mannose-6-phosphate isomerase-like protein (cupin superfamily)